jgi:hypothetical protein
MPPKATPIPQNNIANKLASTSLSGQNVRALLRSEAWNELDSRNAQLVFLDTLAWIDCAFAIDSGHLAGIFDLSRDREQKVLTKLKGPSRSPPRPITITHDQK